MSQQPPTKTPSNHARLALIPILIVVLGIIVYRNRTSVDPPVSLENDAETLDAVGSTTGPEALRADGRAGNVHWPDIDLTTTLARNPFLPPDSLRKVVAGGNAPADPQPSAAADEDEIRRSIEALDVQAVYQSHHGPAAVIGTRILRIGDRLGPHLRVADIRPDGVVLEVADE